MLHEFAGASEEGKASSMGATGGQDESGSNSSGADLFAPETLEQLVYSTVERNDRPQANRSRSTLRNYRTRMKPIAGTRENARNPEDLLLHKRNLQKLLRQEDSNYHI